MQYFSFNNQENEYKIIGLLYLNSLFQTLYKKNFMFPILPLKHLNENLVYLPILQLKDLNENLVSS